MFFNYLDQVMTPGVDMNLTVSKTETGLIVMVMPKVNGLDDPAQNNLAPLMLKGTPGDLDTNFFPSITTPLQKTSGLLLNMKAYEEQAAKAAAASKSVKDQKDRETKEAKEKKDKCDGFMKKAEELDTAGKLDEAIIQFQQARLHATEKVRKTVDEKIAAIRAKLGQGSLFDLPAAAAVSAAQDTASMQAPAPATTQPQEAHQIAQPAADIRPNTHDFGIFGQSTQSAATTPAPAGYSPDPPFATAMSMTATCRENEYEEIVDFPPEMRPPALNGEINMGMNL